MYAPLKPFCSAEARTISGQGSKAGLIIKIKLGEIKQLSLLNPYNNKWQKDTLPGT
jgi:hypothetical protein